MFDDLRNKLLILFLRILFIEDAVRPAAQTVATKEMRAVRAERGIQVLRMLIETIATEEQVMATITDDAALIELLHVANTITVHRILDGHKGTVDT